MDDWDVAAETFEPAKDETPERHPASSPGLGLLRWVPFLAVLALVIYANRGDVGVLASNALACGLLYVLYELGRGRIV